MKKKTMSWHAHKKKDYVYLMDIFRATSFTDANSPPAPRTTLILCPYDLYTVKIIRTNVDIYRQWRESH
jgi:hypothetical protein